MSKYTRLVEKELQTAKENNHQRLHRDSNNNNNNNNATTASHPNGTTSGESSPSGEPPPSPPDGLPTKKNRLSKRNISGASSAPIIAAAAPTESSSGGQLVEPPPPASTAVATGTASVAQDPLSVSTHERAVEEGHTPTEEEHEEIEIPEEAEEDAEEEAALAAQVDLSEDDHCVVCCDACPHLVFHSYDALHAHAVALHGTSHFPDYARLTEVTRKLRPHWAALVRRSTAQNAAVGHLMFRMALERDAGEAKMREAHAARQQLETIVQQWHPQAKVFIFGSSVALGCWDGIADIDFTVVDVGQYEQGVWPPPERNAVRSVTELLRRVGFSYFNLAPIAHARVPIVKHHASAPIRLSEACRAHLRQVYGPAPPHRSEADANGGGSTALEAEHVIARSVRFQLSEPVTTADRMLFEASIQQRLRAAAAEGRGGALLQSWWNRDGTNYCATFDSTNTAVRAATTTFQLSTPTLRVRAQPLHEEVRPELFNIDFDLSFRAFGIRNSVFLHRYLIQHPCARPGAIVLKEWSKTCGINNSAHGYLTSYAINIMWIYYLVRKGHVAYVDPIADVSERLRGPLAPPLDPPYIPLVDRSRIDTGDWEKTANSENPENSSASGAAGGASSGQRLATAVDAGELLLGFFYFYACEFDWTQHVVSLNRPGVTTKKMLGWDTEELTTSSSGGGSGNSSHNNNNTSGHRHVTRYSFCIEDPYEDNLNLGRHMGITKTCNVLAEFHRGLVSLLKDAPAASCVFAGASAAAAAAVREPKEAGEEGERSETDAAAAREKHKKEKEKQDKEGSSLCGAKRHEAQMLRHRDIFLKAIEKKEAGQHPLVERTVASVMTKDSMPLRALYILLSVVLKELSARQQQHVSASGPAAAAPAAATAVAGIPLPELEQLLRQQAPNAFQIVSKGWNLQQLVHRLGLKIHFERGHPEKGVVMLRRELGVVKRAAPPAGVLPLSSPTGEEESTTAAAPAVGAAARAANALPARGLALQLQQALAEGYLRLTPLWTCWSRPWASLRPLHSHDSNPGSANKGENGGSHGLPPRQGGSNRVAGASPPQQQQQQRRSYSTAAVVVKGGTGAGSHAAAPAVTPRKLWRLLFHK